MTVDALAGAHAGAATRDSDVSGDDTYETARTFESLGVSPELTNALADEGIVSAFPIQALTIADALAGRDVCGKAKTGSGKTLAFGVPLLQRAKATSGGAGPAARQPPGQAAGAGPAADPGARRPGARRAGPAGQEARAATPSPSTAAPTSTARWPSSARGSTWSSPRPGRLIDLGDRGEVAVDRARDAGARRGRPHGRHGVHAPGRVGAPAPRPVPPDAAVLRHPRRRGRPPGQALPDRPGLPRGGLGHPDGHRHGAPLPPGAPDGQGQGGGGHLPEPGEVAPLRAHQAGRRPSGREPGQGGDQGRGHPRRPAPGQPGAGPGRLLEREAAVSSWPPTWRPGACTSTASTASSTTTRPRTTRPTCTARAARPVPAGPASW